MDTKQAGANVAISSQADAVALAAERLGYRGNDSKFRLAIAERPTGCRLCSVLSGQGSDGDFGLNSFQNFAAGHNVFALPRSAGVQRHKLDHPHHDVFLHGEMGQCPNLVVVQAANDDGVDFDRSQAKRLGQADGFEHIVEPIAAGDFSEVFAVK